MSYACSTCTRTFGRRAQAKCARFACPGRTKNGRGTTGFELAIQDGPTRGDVILSNACRLSAADDSKGGAID